MTRVAWLTIVAMKRGLGDAVYNALLFHECDELIKVVVVVIELKSG